jgi:hypothetical protein
MFPPDFDPKSTKPELRVPVCVIVEFDELKLPDDLSMGEGKKRWVPIFHEKTFSGAEEKVTRKQFPLTLAWALTHWKAQGMTLRKVRIA